MPTDAKQSVTNATLSADQVKLAGKYKELERVILRMAEVMQTTDPKRAALLRQAFAQSKEKQINSQYEDLVKLLQQEQLYQASKGQAAMQQDLDQLLQLLLSGERDKQIPNERAEIKKYIERINKLIRESRKLLQELGREPTSEEIAFKMDIAPEKVREIIKVSQEPVSLETPIGEEEDSHLGDFIEDAAAMAPQASAPNQRAGSASSVARTATNTGTETATCALAAASDPASGHSPAGIATKNAATSVIPPVMASVSSG